MLISALESDLETRNKQLHKSKDDLIMCEAERNALREQIGSDKGATKSTAKATAPAAAKTVTFNGTKYKWDDLKIVEGIGPKIAELLTNAGITTWAQLAVTSPYQLREILDAGGSQYNVAVPDSWPHQADLADKEDWDGLKKLQDELTGGRAE
jgi:predicted flap endonuclease-1-like 5' DNA nuclease